MNFGDPNRSSAMKKLCGSTHWEVVKTINGAQSYCMKEESRVEGPYEFGVRPKVLQ